MEKQTVFIKVPINDNHIGVLDFYITPSGKRIWGQVYLEQSTCLWQCYEPKTDVVWYVTHALEEIELPSEEEIEAGHGLTHHPHIVDFNNGYIEGFEDGANFIINHLKSNTNGNTIE